MKAGKLRESGEPSRRCTPWGVSGRSQGLPDSFSSSRIGKGMQVAVMTSHIFGGAREIEGRDSVGLYLDEIAQTPLLDAATEVELAKTIEAGLFAEHLLAEGR